MGFYEQIAPYYDYIFPAGREQLAFIKDAAGAPPRKLLDIACGTGVYSVELACDRYEVWATDIDAEMVRRANIRASAENVPIKVLECDMLQLGSQIDEKFDCIFCIGNSIVHLGGKEAILAAVRQMRSRLHESGNLLLQIINFDRILEKGITALPSILNKEAGIEFHRNYSLDHESGMIYFDTVLSVDKNGRTERYENRIPLFPLLSSELRCILGEAGFSEVKFYGGFSCEPYIAQDSYLLVVKAAF